MIDKSHKISDNILDDLKRELNKQYNIAYKEIKNEIARIIAVMDLTSKNPQERFRELQKYDRLKRITQNAAERINEVNKLASKDINNLGATIYQLNYNAAAGRFGYKEIDKTKAVQRYDKVDFYNVLAIDALKDVSVLQRKLESAITSAVLLSSGTNTIFKAVKNTTETALVDSNRIATTTTTLTENEARYDVAKKAESNGIIITKVWRAVGDKKTRPAHRAASGQVRKLDEPFIVGGEKLMYPGDWSLGASPSNTINCRCAMALVERIDEGHTS